MSLVSVIDPAHGAGQRLGVAWGVGNQMAVHVAPGDGQVGGVSVPASRVHEVRWETTLYEPVYRKLVNESAATFLGLQKLAEEEQKLSTEQLVKISRQYRSVMRDCQEQLDALSENGPPSLSGHYLQQSELIYKLELVWNLLEILFIDITPGGLVMPHLLHWVSLHFPRCQDLARSVLSQGSDAPEQHADYWEAVVQFLLQGRTEQARNLLRLHSEFSSDAFISLDELIRKMPLCSASATTSKSDFDFRWRHWQVEVVARLQEGDFAACPDLTFVAELLAGAEDALTKAADKCETWYQWMVARLLYTQPTVKAYDLSFHAQQAIDKFGGLSSMTTLDSVLLAAVETDIPQVFRELCLTLDNFWFSSHLLDLLHHTGQLSSLSEVPGNNGEGSLAGAGLREFLLLDYATSLLSHNSLWQLGIVYLDHCPVQGRPRAEALLERVALTSEYKAGKVVQLAAERGLTTVVSSTCKVMGMKALSSGNTGSAMAWALKSQDAKFTTFLADKLLAEYASSGSFSSIDLLDNLGASIVVSDRLTFLGKYREFHRLVEEGKYSGAATLLHSLLWSRLAPKYFWVTLLIDAIPFLAADDILFGSEQTYELMQCLQELSSDTSLPNKQRLLLEEHEPRVRLSLAKNLALALTQEGDVGSSL